MNISNGGSNCLRCGKPRQVTRTYTENVDGNVLSYSIRECLDPECQKKVDELLKSEEDKRKYIKREQEKREESRKQAIIDKKKEALEK